MEKKQRDSGLWTARGAKAVGKESLMKQYKANRGEIYDAETNEQIGVFVTANCTKKLRDHIVKLAVSQLNKEEQGKEISKRWNTSCY